MEDEIRRKISEAKAVIRVTTSPTLKKDLIKYVNRLQRQLTRLQKERSPGMNGTRAHDGLTVNDDQMTH